MEGWVLVTNLIGWLIYSDMDYISTFFVALLQYGILDKDMPLLTYFPKNNDKKVKETATYD